MQFDTKIVGDWDKATKLVRQFPSIAHKTNEQSLKRISLIAEKKAVKHLRDQDLGWQKTAPLNKDYLKRKTKRGGSEKILVDSSTYLQSISSSQKGNKAYTGVFRGVGNYDTGQSVVDIAIIHELGSVKRNIPKRPLWKPTFNEMIDFVKKSNFFANEMMDEFKKRQMI